MDPLSSPQDEEAASAELLRWRGLFDRLPAVVAFWDRDLRNVMANQAYKDWFGFTPGEMKGRYVGDVLGERGLEEVRPHMLAALAGEERTFERELPRPDGGTRHARVSYVPETVDGEVIGFYVLATDVTPQVESGRDLLEAQAMAGMGSYTFRPPGQVEFSPELLRMMGRDPAGASPSLEEFLEMVHPDDIRGVEEARAKADQGLEYEASYRIILDDGTTKHLHSRTRQVLDAAGDVVLLRGVMQDETGAQRAAAELESINNLLSDLIGVLGHDLKQPIAIVRGYLEQTVEDWEVTSEAERLQHVQTALRAAGRMEGLLQDLLTMVNLDAGKLECRTARIHLKSLLDEICEEMTTDLRPDVEDDVYVDADPVHLRQIMANLLGNAQRYGQRPYVLRAGTQGGGVTISLRDHGEGVPPEFVPRLFDRFSRAATGIAATVGGTGFGLYLVRQLAHANNGDATYEPGEPTGSVFSVHLLGSRA